MRAATSPAEVDLACGDILWSTPDFPQNIAVNSMSKSGIRVCPASPRCECHSLAARCRLSDSAFCFAARPNASVSHHYPVFSPLELLPSRALAADQRSGGRRKEKFTPARRTTGTCVWAQNSTRTTGEGREKSASLLFGPLPSPY